jgi:hypothetical protein
MTMLRVPAGGSPGSQRARQIVGHEGACRQSPRKLPIVTIAEALDCAGV